MRADLARNPIFGGLSRLARFVPNDRGLALGGGGLEKIRDGENPLIFPGGTRTRRSSLNPFTKHSHRTRGHLPLVRRTRPWLRAG